MISLTQPARLLSWARELRMGPSSTAKLFGSYYFSRRKSLGKLFPDAVVLTMPRWGRVPLRTNGHDLGLLRQIFLRHDYQMEAKNVRRILDLGANIGMAALYLSRLFPEAEIACVEPSPANLPFLKQTLQLNKVNARVFEAAAGSEPGTIDLYMSDMPDCNSVYPIEGSTGTVKVPLVSVPEIMKTMGWDSIDLLKIDIEGAEREVLGQNNSWLANVRLITGEGHPNVGYTYAQLQADLVRFGFEFETLIPETEAYGASFRAERKSSPEGAPRVTAESTRQ